MTPNRENPPAGHLSLLYRVSRAVLKEGEYGELTVAPGSRQPIYQAVVKIDIPAREF
jgi:hypothetical protein